MKIKKLLAAVTAAAMAVSLLIVPQSVSAAVADVTLEIAVGTTGPTALTPANKVIFDDDDFDDDFDEMELGSDAPSWVEIGGSNDNVIVVKSGEYPEIKDAKTFQFTVTGKSIDSSEPAQTKIVDIKVTPGEFSGALTISPATEADRIVGATLKAVLSGVQVGFADDYANLKGLQYEWYRTTDVNTVIGTGVEYTVTADDVGEAINVRIIGSDQTVTSSKIATSVTYQIKSNKTKVSVKITNDGKDYEIKDTGWTTGNGTATNKYKATLNVPNDSDKIAISNFTFTDTTYTFDGPLVPVAGGTILAVGAENKIGITATAVDGKTKEYYELTIIRANPTAPEDKTFDAEIQVGASTYSKGTGEVYGTLTGVTASGIEIIKTGADALDWDVVKDWLTIGADYKLGVAANKAPKISDFGETYKITAKVNLTNEASFNVVVSIKVVANTAFTGDLKINKGEGGSEVKVGGVLHADLSALKIGSATDIADLQNVTYKWFYFKNKDNLTNPANVIGTAPSYTVKAADIGETIMVAITSAQTGTTVKQSAASATGDGSQAGEAKIESSATSLTITVGTGSSAVEVKTWTGSGTSTDAYKATLELPYNSTAPTVALANFFVNGSTTGFAGGSDVSLRLSNATYTTDAALTAIPSSDTATKYYLTVLSPNKLVKECYELTVVMKAISKDATLKEIKVGNVTFLVTTDGNAGTDTEPHLVTINVNNAPTSMTLVANAGTIAKIYDTAATPAEITGGIVTIGSGTEFTVQVRAQDYGVAGSLNSKYYKITLNKATEKSEASELISVAGVAVSSLGEPTGGTGQSSGSPKVFPTVLEVPFDFKSADGATMRTITADDIIVSDYAEVTFTSTPLTFVGQEYYLNIQVVSEKAGTAQTFYRVTVKRLAEDEEPGTDPGTDPGTGAPKSGDLNGNGKIDPLEISMAIDQYRAGDKTNLTILDINGDGKITTLDISMMIDMYRAQ